MEGQSVVDNLRSRSRSRSNTPLPRTNPDRGTPTRNVDIEPIIEHEGEEVFTSPPAHRTRNALKHRTLPQDNADPSSYHESEETEQSQYNNDRHISEEAIQNYKNYSYEHEQITTTKTQTINSGDANVFLSPSINSNLLSSSLRNSYAYNRPGTSPSCSDKSNESFAESVLADSSRISIDGTDHLPYKVYHNAREYWNKYPKTDYTYSHLSRDRVELAPGQVAVPNMSRLSLGLFRQGHSVYGGGLDEEESIALQNRSDEIRKRWISDNSHRSYNTNNYNYKYSENLVDSDYDENDVNVPQSANLANQRWWITRVLISIVTTIVTTVTSLKDKVLRRDPNQRYPYYSSVNRYNTYSQNSGRTTSIVESIKKRKWWFLPLLLILPLLLYYWLYGGSTYPLYAYFNNNKTVIIERPVKLELTDEMLKSIVLHVKQNLEQNVPQPQIIERIVESPSNNNFDPMLLIHQQDLIEKLYLEVDSLKEKLAANENIDEQIQYLSSKQNMEMLVNMFGLDKRDGSPITNADIKEWLRKETINKDDIELKLSDMSKSISGNMNDAILNAVKNEVAQQQQQQILTSQTLTAPIIHSDGGCNCEEIVHKVVRDMIAIYDADKTGKVDYAMESAGGEVISTRCSESYQPKTAVYTILGIPIWYRSNTPRTAITPGTSPGECWAFQGFPGYLVIKLHTRINVTGFTMEHTPIQLSPTGLIESAPKNFTVWGLQDEMDHEPILFGTYEYSNNSTSIQYFPVMNSTSQSPSGHEIVELRIESNHGHPHHTCLYRFRVHGDPAEDLSFYGSNSER